MDKKNRIARVSEKFLQELEEINEKRRIEAENEGMAIKEVTYTEFTYMITKHNSWNTIREDLYKHNFLEEIKL